MYSLWSTHQQHVERAHINSENQCHLAKSIIHKSLHQLHRASVTCTSLVWPSVGFKTAMYLNLANHHRWSYWCLLRHSLTTFRVYPGFSWMFQVKGYLMLSSQVPQVNFHCKEARYSLQSKWVLVLRSSPLIHKLITLVTFKCEFCDVTIAVTWCWVEVIPIPLLQRSFLKNKWHSKPDLLYHPTKSTWMSRTFLSNKKLTS